MRYVEEIVQSGRPQMTYSAAQEYGICVPDN